MAGWRSLLTALLLLAAPAVSWAQEDARMQVHIAPQEGESLSLQQAMQQALPMLWDRIVVRADRDLLPNKLNPAQFMLKAAPQGNAFIIEFNADRVWPYLDRVHAHYLKQEPALNPDIRVYNLQGLDMAESEQSLLSDLQDHAANWGIRLDAQAPTLVLSWQWLDNNQIALSMRGHPSIPEQQTIFTLQPGDPLPQLAAWQSEALLQGRDAIVSQQAEATPAQEAQAAQTLEVILHIHRQAGLAAQTTLESMLAHDSHVTAITPVYLSTSVQRYRLTLNAMDDSWIPDWFARLGMTAAPTAEGWAIQ